MLHLGRRTSSSPAVHGHEQTPGVAGCKAEHIPGVLEAVLTAVELRNRAKPASKIQEVCHWPCLLCLVVHRHLVLLIAKLSEHIPGI